MSVLLRILSKSSIRERLSNDLIKILLNSPKKCFTTDTSSDTVAEDDDEEFRVLELIPKRRDDRTAKKAFKLQIREPRSKQMPVDQDWSSVWPGPRSFHPATVPLPVHQGYVPKGAPPGKHANAELMKIPNFLHLTPPAIQKHCEALKQFCTKWPDELQSEEQMEEHFPIQIITSDYCHSSPTIRDPDARIVSLKVKLSSLELDNHARDKFLRLVGDRYDPKTDIVTITTDSCPVRQQNYDYAHYLLTALYHESWVTEAWEKEKQEADMEKYIWASNISKVNIEQIFEYTKTALPDTTEYEASVESLFNDGENEYNLDKYKRATLKLLNLPTNFES